MTGMGPAAEEAYPFVTSALTCGIPGSRRSASGQTRLLPTACTRPVLAPLRRAAIARECLLTKEELTTISARKRTVRDPQGTLGCAVQPPDRLQNGWRIR